MKKLISCLLAVLLVCSLMSMSVFADPLPEHDSNKTENVVGKGGETNATNPPTMSNGTNSPNHDSTTDVKVNFGQTTDENGTTTTTNPSGSSDSNTSVIVHRYAVDIIYGEFVLDLTQLKFDDVEVGGTDENGDPTTENKDLFMVWDVNEYKYVLCTKDGEIYTPVNLVDYDKNDENTENDSLGENAVDKDILTQGIDLNSTVTIKNHSDLSISTTLTLAPNRNDIAWEMSKANEGDSAGEAQVNGLEATQTISKATAAQSEVTITKEDGTTETIPASAGKVTTGAEYKFTATPATTLTNGWLDVVGNLINGNVTTIGTITVTVEP